MKGDVTPDLESGQRVFHRYGDDYFQLGQERIESNFFFHLGEVSPWITGDISSLTVADLTWLENKTPEVLVLGTGRRTAFPHADVLDYLVSLHVGYECMDSLSAARTFNILVGEGRKVATAMLLPNVRG
ncbi:MAG: MTH938/NDUFAF3 family protein [Ghiorsea sp.]